MGARWFFLLTALVAPVIAGCGEAPSAKFVLNERTLKLDRAAKIALEGELHGSFGDPNHLVVWRKLPVDFGEFDGVVEQPGTGLADLITVKLTRSAESKTPFKADRLAGAGLVFAAGSSHANLALKDAKGKELPISYQIDSYDSEHGQLRIHTIPADAAGKVPPLAAGEKFTILGPVLQHGHKLYMTHCMHCHGVSGDGNGPTAGYLSPRPRDYRLGRFKFTSTRSTDRIRRDDLDRTIRQGIPGTYMPSFLLLTDEELGAIVEYVRWLAMRGEFEEKSDSEFVSNQYGNEDIAQRVKGGEVREQIETALADYISKEYPKVADQAADDLATAWNGAEQPESVVIPKLPRTPDTPESRERGRKLFFSDLAKCATCHGPSGRGDGPQTEDYQIIQGTTKKRAVPGLFDDWGNPIKPRDLTSGIYRGGRRPLDIYRRIFSGIKGTPMPPFGAALKDEQIWDLVNFAMSIPYQTTPAYPEQQQHIASSSASESRAAGGN